VAHISAVASLLAGSSGIRLRLFLSYAVLGRVVWLFIYFGLGYLVGSDFDMASSFLSYLSLLLLALLLMGLLIELYHKQHKHTEGSTHGVI
jgi:membrane protein DedA with SNARE-associated domain